MERKRDVINLCGRPGLSGGPRGLEQGSGREYVGYIRCTWVLLHREESTSHAVLRLTRRALHHIGKLFEAVIAHHHHHSFSSLSSKQRLQETTKDERGEEYLRRRHFLGRRWCLCGACGHGLEEGVSGEGVGDIGCTRILLH